MRREVILLTGPPAAGKTTLARRLVPSPRHGVVVDLDDLARRFGAQNAEKARTLLERRAAARGAGRVVIIRAAPRARQREHHARVLRARVLLLDPGRDAVMAQAQARGDGPEQLASIDAWYRSFTASDLDRHLASSEAGRPSTTPAPDTGSGATPDP